MCQPQWILIIVCMYVCVFHDVQNLCYHTIQALMIAVITSEIRQGIPSSGIQFCFWGALVVYASIKLRSLILLSRDQVQFSIRVLQFNIQFHFQSEVDDMLHFVTFVINFVVFLVQFVLSVFSDRRSKYQVIGEDNVRVTTVFSFDSNL